MSEYPEATQATDATTLEERIMSQSIPKAEHEWWAKREIQTLRQRVKDCEGAIKRREQHLEQAEAKIACLSRNAESDTQPNLSLILRKQAEAVDYINTGAVGMAVDSNMQNFVSMADIKDYGDSLRQQAEEMEKQNV